MNCLPGLNFCLFLHCLSSRQISFWYFSLVERREPTLSRVRECTSEMPCFGPLRTLVCWFLNSFLSMGLTKCSHWNFLLVWSPGYEFFLNLKIWYKWFDTNLFKCKVQFNPSGSWILLCPSPNSGPKQLTSWLPCCPDAVMPGFVRSPTSLMSKFPRVLFTHLPAHQPLPQGGSYSEAGGLRRRKRTSIESENASYFSLTFGFSLFSFPIIATANLTI